MGEPTRSYQIVWVAREFPDPDRPRKKLNWTAWISPHLREDIDALRLLQPKLIVRPHFAGHKSVL